MNRNDLLPMHLKRTNFPDLPRPSTQRYLIRSSVFDRFDTASAYLALVLTAILTIILLVMPGVQKNLIPPILIGWLLFLMTVYLWPLNRLVRIYARNKANKYPVTGEEIWETSDSDWHKEIQRLTEKWKNTLIPAAIWTYDWGISCLPPNYGSPGGPQPHEVEFRIETSEGSERFKIGYPIKRVSYQQHPEGSFVQFPNLFFRENIAITNEVHCDFGDTAILYDKYFCNPEGFVLLFTEETLQQLLSRPG